MTRAETRRRRLEIFRLGRITDRIVAWKTTLSLCVILALGFSMLITPSYLPLGHASVCSSGADDTVDGRVFNSNTGAVLSGIDVYVVACIVGQAWGTTTDSNGYFSFNLHLLNGDPCFVKDSSYVVSVNGVTSYTQQGGCNGLSHCILLGVAADDTTSGQWIGDVSTTSTSDGSGYGNLPSIQISLATEIYVPSAALYSSTQYASLDFSSTNSGSVTSGVSVTVGSGSSVTAGYQHNFDYSASQGLTNPANSYNYLAQYSYAIVYYCADSSALGIQWSCTQGLKTAGLTKADNNYLPGSRSTSEYVTPSNLKSGSYIDCVESTSAPTSFAYSWSSGSSSLNGISASMNA